MRKISHITHNHEARRIESEDGYYKFKAQKKFGKKDKYGATAYGESFRCLIHKDDSIDSRYKRISPNDLVLPGWYSWWGLSTSGWLDKDKKSTIENLKKKGFDHDSLAPYLQDPPKSRYGGNEFSGDLHEVLSCYQDSRHPAPDEPKPDIYLLQGGTLRYKCEICCVVIVCTGEDKESDALKDYKPLQQKKSTRTDNPIFDLNGLVDDEGKMRDQPDYSNVPIFYPRYLLCDESKSWANLAFAFYFNESQEKPFFKCLKDVTVSKGKIEHDNDILCVRYWQNDRCCPDQ